MHLARPGSESSRTGPTGRVCARVTPALALLAAGCIEFGLDPIEPNDDPHRRATVTETFVQAPLPKVDLLLVIDRTASMDQELGALVDAGDLLAAELDDAGIAWQLGAVGTEIAHDAAGWLLGTPWILTPPGDPGTHLEAILAEPLQAPAEEAGVAAAIRALELSGLEGVNAGFRRPDAALHVVFLSDGDDDSAAAIGGDPELAMLAALEAEASNGLPATASAVVGDVPGGCTGPFGSAQPGTSYAAIAQATGGAVVSICSTNFAPVVEAIGAASIVLQDRFALREQPAGALTVRVDGEPATGWSFDAEAGELVFDPPPPAGAEVVVSYPVRVDG